MVMVHVAGSSNNFHTSDIKYNKVYLSRFFKGMLQGNTAVATLKRFPSLNVHSLTSQLIGNMVINVLVHHATPLQIGLGVLMHRKKIIQHMYNNNVTCTYDEWRRYERSSAVARTINLKREERAPVDGLVQIIADNFNADMSSPNGNISTHSLAMIECFHVSNNTTEVVSLARITRE